MTQPVTPFPNQVPVLTEVVQINDSLRPAILPWQVKPQLHEALPFDQLNQEQLADKVIEKVQARIAELMPELLKESVDQVLKEHAQSPSRQTD
jgi:hypothetical protein